MSATLKRIGIAAAVTVLVLAAVVVVVFALGKPMAPQASSVTTASAEPSTAQPPAPAAAGGSDPLAVQIPGCVCHSDDPKLVEEHASYRMSQCFDCHQGGVPEMEQ